MPSNEPRLTGTDGSDSEPSQPRQERRFRIDATRPGLGLALQQPAPRRSMTPQSGIVRTAASEDRTRFAIVDDLPRPEEFPELEATTQTGAPDLHTSSTRIGLFGVVPKEPATEPHLVAANPFDGRSAREGAATSAATAPEVATTDDGVLIVAPPVARRRPKRDGTLVGLGDDTSATLRDYPFDSDQTPSSVAGVPPRRSKGSNASLVRHGRASLLGFALNLSERVLQGVLGFASTFTRRKASGKA